MLLIAAREYLHVQMLTVWLTYSANDIVLTHHNLGKQKSQQADTNQFIVYILQPTDCVGILEAVCGYAVVSAACIPAILTWGLRWSEWKATH